MTTQMIAAKPAPSKGAHLYKHGYTGTSLYGRWRRMIQRCTDPSLREYPHYGGRGIKVCERWHDFRNFLADMGEPSSGMTLDRIDSSGDYCPENCRWADKATQMRNTRRTHMLTYQGRTQCLKDWASEIGIETSTLRNRLRKWPYEKAMSNCKFSTNGKPLN